MASPTPTLALKDSTESPFYYPNKPFVNGIHDEWANGLDDQRHTLTVTGRLRHQIWLSLSGLFHYGSGNAFATAVGTTAAHRLRPELQPHLRRVNTSAYRSGRNRPSATPDGPTRASPSITTLPTTTSTPQQATGSHQTRRTLRTQCLPDGHPSAGSDTSSVIGSAGVMAVEAFNRLQPLQLRQLQRHRDLGDYGTPRSHNLPATGIPVEWRRRSCSFLDAWSFRSRRNLNTRTIRARSAARTARPA